MARINKPPKHDPIVTHEGGQAVRITPEKQLRRTIMAGMLWEDSFYEDGQDVADRIAQLVPKVNPVLVSAMAIECRNEMKLRHMPLLVAREMARNHMPFTRETLAAIIQRPDELTEFLAIYWMEGKTPIAKQVKLGLGDAFQKFNAYQLAKYNRDDAIKLRDVLFMVHAKPKDEQQAEVWKQLVDNTLPIPGTWENRLSAGEDPKDVFTDLIQKNELGALAFLRNLRNMTEAKVDPKLIKQGLENMKVERVLPFRFISAAKYAPKYEAELEQAMYRCLEGIEKIPGKTVLLVDVSGSMRDVISAKSELQRWETAAGLGILSREMCDDVAIYVFNDYADIVPNRRGMALKDYIGKKVRGGTETAQAVNQINKTEDYDNIIIFTDEQSSDGLLPDPKGNGFVVNVANYNHGIGYGKWTHVDGWSESTLKYIQSTLAER